MHKLVFDAGTHTEEFQKRIPNFCAQLRCTLSSSGQTTDLLGQTYSLFRLEVKVNGLRKIILRTYPMRWKSTDSEHFVLHQPMKEVDIIVRKVPAFIKSLFRSGAEI